MISREELERIAKLSGMKAWQQEKHYIQSIMLVALSEHPLVFKGGTCLWFFHGLNRFSEDLDFTATGALPGDLGERVSANLRLYGVENSLKKIETVAGGVAFRIGAEGPLHSSDSDICYVYVEISGRGKPMLPALQHELNREMYSLPLKIVSGMAMDEIAAEKVRAILMRDKARDVFDLPYLIQKKKVKFDLPMVMEKLKPYGIEYSKELLGKKVAKKKPSWKKELSGMVFGKLPEFDECAEAILEWAK